MHNITVETHFPTSGKMSEAKAFKRLRFDRRCEGRIAQLLPIYQLIKSSSVIYFIATVSMLATLPPVSHHTLLLVDVVGSRDNENSFGAIIWNDDEDVITYMWVELLKYDWMWQKKYTETELNRTILISTMSQPNKRWSWRTRLSQESVK